MFTFHHANTRGSKSCKAQDCTSLCPCNNCHPRVMSHSLPHLTLTTSTSSLSSNSSTSPILPDGLIFANKPYDRRPIYPLRYSTAEWRINTNPISHRNGAELMSANLMENGSKTAEDMMLNFAESGHPTFRATSASERRRIEKPRQRSKNPFTSTVVMTPLN